jgi:membrane fusion protein, multidrug efflux system
MTFPNILIRLLGIALGLVLLTAGILGVLFLSRPKPEQMPSVPVRPVKTMLVGGPVPTNLRRYPGKVQAAERVQMSFELAGAIEELPVKSGQQVKKGEVLAKLDPRDFQNAYNAKKAVESERRVNMERFQIALAGGGATVKEVDEAVATYEVAKAESAIAKKALEDTVIRAPFDGVIAYTLVRQYQKVAAKEAILSLQDPSRLEIVIQLPEQVVAFGASDGKGRSIAASFDYLPNREFPMKVKEYATEADPATQTYPVTLEMPAPKDVTILPGMSATVSISAPPIVTNKAEGYPLPLTAVPADGNGQFYVWFVEPAKDDLYTVRRQNVSVGPMTKEYVLVTQGVASQQRVVTAGVHLLENGQQVRLLNPEKREGTP